MKVSIVERDSAAHQIIDKRPSDGDKVTAKSHSACNESIVLSISCADSFKFRIKVETVPYLHGKSSTSPEKVPVVHMENFFRGGLGGLDIARN